MVRSRSGVRTSADAVSDGAFKLYVHACLRADHHTGCVAAIVNELALALARTPDVVAMHVAELENRAVCCITRDGNSNSMIEIHDRFRPYQRQQTPGRTLGAETEFVEKVRGLETKGCYLMFYLSFS